MKKKIFTLGIGLMTALAFVSCDRGGGSVEDDNNSNLIELENKILGRWKIEKELFSYDGQQEIIEKYYDNECSSKSYYDFYINNIIEINYTDDGCNSIIEKHNWVLENEKFTVTYSSGKKSVFHILELEEKKFRLRVEEDLNNDGKLDSKLYYFYKP